MLKSKLFPKDSERSRADKLLSNNRIEHLVLKTKPTKDLELRSNPETLAKTKKLMEQAEITKAKAMSPMVDAFLVAADGRVTTTKISMDVSTILKSVGVTLLQADGLTMLSYKLAQQYGGEAVTLEQMLKDKNFKAAYQAAK
ncbi:hypothetical protein [Pseudomonas oryzihabitans]|uniref:hypothetical protein n=1 Tax=Pseudomonas oryzihabitans TaxID=47885 RepID=UPI0012DDAEBD|nr:hypothetical protein [Pseudomonas oryzihabitans]NMZ47160.1 hypothetical protein [Pseudomonas oryzihabitans]